MLLKRNMVSATPSIGHCHRGLYGRFNGWRTISVLGTFALLLLGACGGGGAPEQRGEVSYATAADMSKIPIGGTMRIGVLGNPISLLYLTNTEVTGTYVLSNIFNQLAILNPDLETYTPDLAKRWFFSRDRKKLTFILRNDVRWHDGAKFTAADVVFTERLNTSEVIGWSAISWKRFIESVEAVDDTTVVYHFNKVYPYQFMDASVGYILPEHLLGDVPEDKLGNHAFNRNPVGTGPFIFKEWKSQESVTLERNPNYFLPGKPYLDRLLWIVIPDRTSQLAQLKKGQIDMMMAIPPKDFQSLKEAWEGDRTKTRPYEYLGRSYDYIGWNLIDPQHYLKMLEKEREIKLNKDPDFQLSDDEIFRPNKFFASVKVRRALTMAINREQITQAVNYGMATTMHGPIPLILWAYNPALNAEIEIPYDLEKARQMLAEEGWQDRNGDGILDKNGEPFRFTMISNSGNERREQAMTMVQNDLARVGVKMDLQLLEASLLFGERMPNKNFEAALIGWSVGLKMDYTPLFHSSGVRVKFNFPTYRNTAFDAVNDAAIEIMDRAKAQEKWDEVQRILSHDQPYTWLYYRKEGNGLHKRFKDMQMDRRGPINNLHEVWVPVEERLDIDWLATGR